MTYKLNHDLRKTQSPEVLVLEGKETEYPNCAAVTELLFKEKYVISSVSARDSRIFIEVAEAAKAPDSRDAWIHNFKEVSFF